MDMNTENRINKVMNSLENIQQAEASPFLYAKIIHKVNNRIEAYAPAKLVWLAAASFALLLFLNFQALRSTKTSNTTTSSSDIEQLANGYQLINNNSINY